MKETLEWLREERGNKVPAASLRVKSSARGDKAEAVAHLSQHQDHHSLTKCKDLKEKAPGFSLVCC